MHTCGQLLFYHGSGQGLPYITGHCVDTVNLGWVGVPNERTLFRIHDAVVGFVDRFLAWTRNLATFNQTSVGVFLKPILAQHRPQIVFLGFFKSLELSVRRIAQTFSRKFAFSL